MPSWEAFFGAAGELLYYSPHVKADYTPFLARCVGGADVLRRFFDALYFRTVSEALGEIRLGEQEDRALARIRSLSFRPGPGEALFRRPADQGLLPTRAAPVDMYLKAKSSSPPRTWVSGLAERVRRAGAGQVVEAARRWWSESVDRLLSNPKERDPEGDYFIAWLRECHREVYDDVDTSDPRELRSSHWAKSKSRRKHRHDLRGIKIPGFEAAFAEIAAFDYDARVSTRRERALAKILVDAFQIRLVDLAAILSVADAVATSPSGARVVVVLYAGADHTKNVEEFWRGQGFGDAGLQQGGRVGKEDWEDDEVRCFELPGYLQDMSALFPVP